MRQIALSELAELYKVGDSDGNLKIEYDLWHDNLLRLGLDPTGPGEEMQLSIVRYALHIIRSELETNATAAHAPQGGE